MAMKHGSKRKVGKKSLSVASLFKRNWVSAHIYQCLLIIANLK